MCLESLVAIMALIAACTLDPGVYFSVNMKGDHAQTVAAVTALHYPVTVEQMDQVAASIGEKTLFGRVGGAPTLAVGMAKVFSNVFNGAGMDLWYHFAIMFEALFILTTLDAGTRVGRYLLQDLLGHVWKPLGETCRTGSAWMASFLVVGSWGWFLIQGVRDPLGGINSLWPLFGIANQLLAAIALCLATTVILKMQLKKNGRSMYALVTLVPLLWLLVVTSTASVEKIFHSNPKIGFLAVAKTFTANPALRFNALLDAVVTALLLAMILAIALLSFREWILLLARKKLISLSETEPMWLPAYAIAETGPRGALSLFMLALLLIKELSGENAIQRTRESQPLVTADRAYLEVAKKRFDGINRCC